MIPSDELDCRELLELVTEYLEGALSAPTRVRFEAHLRRCDDCEHHLDQMRQTLDALGSLPEESLSTAVKQKLLWAFRTWKQLP